MSNELTIDQLNEVRNRSRKTSTCAVVTGDIIEAEEKSQENSKSEE